MSAKTQSSPEKTSAVKSFLFRERKADANARLPAISLFSGAGLSDLGYELAGFKFLVHSELDANRAALCKENFPRSKVVVGDLSEEWEEVVAEYGSPNEGQLHLLSVTPPCQGMSSSNPGRGKVSNSKLRDKRNRLLLEAIPVIKELKPRVVVAENVMQVLKETVDFGSKLQKVVEAFGEELSDYQLFAGVVQVADYGVPQVRKRAILVAMRRDEPCLDELQRSGALPWPRATRAEKPVDGLRPWVTLETWLNQMDYPTLDARNEESARCEDDPLHFVPAYEGDRYSWVADIPPRSGQSAYQNSNCRSCGHLGVPEWKAFCPRCEAPMTNRPYVREKDGAFRLIKGFKSSYRRMFPDRPAPTITTASSHLGSDYKIHPWENRVLSIRECADLQTVPRFYDWGWAIRTRHTYLARQVIGEALPPWFTYLHGLTLRDFLSNRVNADSLAQPNET